MGLSVFFPEGADALSFYEFFRNSLYILFCRIFSADFFEIFQMTTFCCNNVFFTFLNQNRKGFLRQTGSLRSDCKSQRGVTVTNVTVTVTLSAGYRIAADLLSEENIQIEQESDDAQNFNRKKNDHPGVQIYGFQDLTLRNIFWHGFIKLKRFPLDPSEQQDEP